MNFKPVSFVVGGIYCNQFDKMEQQITINCCTLRWYKVQYAYLVFHFFNTNANILVSQI